MSFAELRSRRASHDDRRARMGTAYGAVFLISTIGMGVGSFAGGWIHDRLGTYVWLYGASFAVAVLAVLFAFTFRTQRRVVALG